MQLMKEKQDLTYLSWSVNRNSFGIGGSFLKAYSELGGKKTYYKLSNFDKARGIIGHECVNELIMLAPGAHSQFGPGKSSQFKSER